MLYWIASLTSLHVTPTLLVFAGISPLVDVLITEANDTNKQVTAKDVIGILIALSAISIQRVADNQLYYFRKNQYQNSKNTNLDQLSSSKKSVEMDCGIGVVIQIILEKLFFGLELVC